MLWLNISRLEAYDRKQFHYKCRDLKLPPETKRNWGEVIKMDSDVVKKIDDIWAEILSGK